MPRFSLHPAPLAIRMAIALASGAVTAQAEGPARPVAIQLERQPLAQALNALALQTRLELIVQPALVAGRMAPAVAGQMTPRQALGRLLDGSGLVARLDGTAVTVQAAPPPSADVTMAPVTVTALGERSAVTEQTGSYTSRELSIGKLRLSVRETPQSVSAVTQQQMEDQHLVTLEQVLGQATGVTRTTRNFGDHRFSVRGFVIQDDNQLVDGVPGMLYSATGWLPVDMAIYDRVEVLRGAGGLIVGAGDPSGAVNLVRKRPRAQAHADVSVSAGSWHNYRTELDAGMPLNAEGTLRGRVVAGYEDRRYFYDLAHARQPLLYGVVEADLGRDTRLTIGARHQEKDIGAYWLFGLPRYSDGGALDVPRSTSLAQDWNRHDASVNEVFGELERRFGDDWKARLTVNRSNGGFDQKLALARGVVERGTLAGPRLYSLYFKNLDVVTTGIDASLAGSFQALGGTHQFLAGANWSRRSEDDKGAAIDDGSPIDPFHPDHFAVAEPVRPAWTSALDVRDQRAGLYASARLELAQPLHLLLGGRVSWLNYRSADRISGDQVAGYDQNREFTPYAGLVYDVGRLWSWYASYADTFQPQSKYFTAGGQPLKPAIGANYETGLKGELYDGRLNATLALFQVRKTGNAELDVANDGPCDRNADGNCYRNASTLQSKGVEAEVSGEAWPGLQLTAGYTYVTSRADDGSSISAETPRHLLRMAGNYRLPGRWRQWSLGGGVAAQTGYATQAPDNDAVRIADGGRAVWDLHAAYIIDRSWTVALNVANAFDKNYWANLGELRRGNYYGEPRNVTLTLRAAF
ncbi:TonB-dependent siderophore receptor [Janthinobacterium agaricidamnosum]|uniref:Fe(3+)-pyochelin receptor n=1 Tax=Janthinobacterium agaricidamnosum NBRC 102515 = DSM 9628 TaxID=1349767 RepID=W0VDI5_9BURK|nr:TonB-dependent receptor [Janthinobacterium agaricidamnosum]CDG85966.1 fe(3+)-pyochelin receptor [Janthinobacterium agaricidamnosum NBRC 102515 = DSM 9628]